MTEAELIESAGIYFALNADMLSLYLTATSAFLIVAYIVGHKLTGTQLVIVSGLYLIFAVVSTYLAVGYGMRGLSYARLVGEVNPEIEVYATNAVPVAMAIVLLCGMAASLKFMWDVRHTKNE